MTTLQSIIENAFEKRSEITPGTVSSEVKNAISETMEGLNHGVHRVASRIGSSQNWETHQWIKKAVLLSFRIEDNVKVDSGYTNYFDKVKSKFYGYSEDDFKKGGFRVVPNAMVRHGSFIGKNAVLMPSYVNIGAYVDEGTMVDTWATVGSCAQIGKNVHLSGGVGIGGVLEPLQAAPVIIEDNAFVGSRCIVVEGVRVETEAVLGAGVVLTMSTKIIDVTGDEPVEYKGVVPARSVVIPGSYVKEFPSGNYNVPCALIIGKRKESTNKKTSLNDALRTHNVAV